MMQQYLYNYDIFYVVEMGFNMCQREKQITNTAIFW